MTLVPAGFVPLPPGAQPGFDHADIHRPAGRVYVAHTGADRVGLIDSRRRGRANVGEHPNGLAYDRRRRHLYAFNLGEPLGENYVETDETEHGAHTTV